MLPILRKLHVFVQIFFDSFKNQKFDFAKKSSFKLIKTYKNAIQINEIKVFTSIYMYL